MRPVRAAVAAAVAAAVVVPALAGCGLLGSSFDPHADDVEQARAAVAPAVQSRLDAVAAGRTVRGTFADDACQIGQNNWKVHDGFERSCVLGLGAVVDGAATLDDVGPQLTAMHESLVAQGCTARLDGTGLSGTARRYWEEFRERPNYGPDDLPGESYACPGGVTVSVDSSAPDAKLLENETHLGFWTPQETVSEQRLTGARLLALRAAPVAQLFVVKVSRRYFVV